MDINAMDGKGYIFRVEDRIMKIPNKGKYVVIHI